MACTKNSPKDRGDVLLRRLEASSERRKLLRNGTVAIFFAIFISLASPAIGCSHPDNEFLSPSFKPSKIDTGEYGIQGAGAFGEHRSVVLVSHWWSFAHDVFPVKEPLRVKFDILGRITSEVFKNSRNSHFLIWLISHKGNCGDTDVGTLALRSPIAS